MKKGWLLLGIVVFLIGNFLLYSPSYSILNQLEKYQLEAVTDKHFGGNSELTYSLKPNQLSYRYKKSNAILGAFVAIFFQRKDTSYFQLEGYRIRVKGKVEGKGAFGMRLEVDPEVPYPIPPHYIFLQRILFSNQGIIDETIDLDEFEIPWWWAEKHNLLNQDKPIPNFNRTIRLLFDGGEGFGDKDYSTVTIDVIELIPTYWGMKIFNGIYFLLVLVVLVFQHLKSRKKNIYREVVAAPYEKTMPATDSSTEDVSLVIAYLARNYMKFDFSLGSMSDELGVNQRRISEIIKDTFEMTFKQYLNYLRISEAKNLLQQTSQRVSEIAYTVGYDNPNHFLRVFKSQTNQTPSEFRENLNK